MGFLSKTGEFLLEQLPGGIKNWIRGKDARRQELIEKWRTMIYELKGKNNQASSPAIKLKILLEGHKDYFSLHPRLGEKTKNRIKWDANDASQDTNDEVLTLMQEDIDKIEEKWKLHD